MSANIDQKTYLLNKYLKPLSGDKKKKKKKHVKGSGLRIIDDDLDTSRLRPLEADEVEALGLGGEDAPQIAGIVDERPQHIREMEEFQAPSKWRVIAQNEGGDSKLRVEEVERDRRKEKEENTVIFGKMYSDSEDDKKNDSDLSPPRKQTNAVDDKQNTVGKRKTKDSGKRIEKQKRGSDSDLSPPRSRQRRDRDNTPVKEKSRKKSPDSDVSPPRRNEVKSKERSRKNSRWGDFPTEEVYRKQAEKHKKSSNSPLMYIKNSDSDQSPPRKTNRTRERDRSADSDLSPPRRKNKEQQRKDRSNDSDQSPPRRKQELNRIEKKRDKSASPSRRRDEHKSKRKREESIDSDQSPPRKKDSSRSERNDYRSKEDQTKRKRDRSIDSSPPRRQFDAREGKSYKTNLGEKGTGRYDDWRRNNDRPPPSNKKMAKTLEGKTAGLQDARSMREEAAILRRREDEFYNKMAPEASGRNATAVNRRLGKRETSEDRQKNKEKEEKKKEMERKYNQWGKGLKQIADQERRVEDYLHEASKPLARSRDDADLERALKAVEREGDPMLGYLKSKRTDEQPERPMYKGDWPPNRFNIRPGYRWDGVDRSNGYEKKYFEQKSKNKALEEEAYKWSTEDL